MSCPFVPNGDPIGNENDDEALRAEKILLGRTGVSRTMVFFTDLLVFFVFHVFPRDCFFDSLSLFRASR